MNTIPRSDSVSDSINKSLIAEFGDHYYVHLTPTECCAVHAAGLIAFLYNYDKALSVIEAFGNVVRRMRPETRYIAHHAMMHALSRDFGLWISAGLPEEESEPPFHR